MPPTRSSLDNIIANLARHQDGLVCPRQLQPLGLTTDQIRYRLKAGRFERVHRGVYRLGGTPETYRQLVRAAYLAHPGAVVSHRSAAVLWEVGRLVGDRWLADQPVDIAVPYAPSPELDGVHVHRSLDLTDEQVSWRSGMRITNPLRLCVDSGAVLPWWYVETILERLIERRIVTPTGARLALDQLSRRGRRGCGVLRRVLDRRALGSAVTDSRAESVFAQICHDHDIPIPQYQYQLVVAGRRRRIDFADVELRIAVEIDGYDWHAIGEPFYVDRAKDVELAALGWLTIRFTWRDLVFRPTWVAERFRAVRMSRSAFFDRY